MNDTVSISTPDHVTLEFELAGLGSRFLAHAVDAILIVLLVILFWVVLLVAGLFSIGDLDGVWQNGSAWTSSWAFAILLFLIFLTVWGYYVFFECVMHGSTPGKHELGIRVIRVDGLPIGFREAAIRNLVRAADAFPPPSYLLGGIVLFLNPHGQRLGDMVAGTLVVRQKFEPHTVTTSGAAWAARVEQGLSRRALTLPGGAMAPNQVDLVEQFLQRRHALGEERREDLAWRIAAPLLPLLGEDRTAWENKPDRGPRCERFLLELVEMAQPGERSAPRPSQARSTIMPGQGGLF